MHNKINLLHIVGYIYPFAGMERKVIQLINNLDKSVFNVSLAGLIMYDERTKGFLNQDIKLFFLDKKEGIDLKIIFRLADILRQHKIDIIHSHNWTTLLYAVLAAKIARTPVIIHGEHGIETKEIEDTRLRFYLKKILYNQCQRLITVSDDIRQSIINRYGINNHKITVIYNGVEVHEKSDSSHIMDIKIKYGLQKYKKIIGTVGRIKQVKDFETLIKAFKIVKDKYADSALVIVGPGNDKANDYYAQLINLIEELDLNNVLFTGTITDIDAILSTFDIFVNSSLSEGISNTILEAMANNVPVAASRVGGNPELVRDNESGLLFESQNEADCAECILKVLDERIKINYLVDSAYRNVRVNHSMDSMFKKNTAIYEKMLSDQILVSGTRLSHFTKTALSRLAGYSGFPALFSKNGSNQFSILTFHRVVKKSEMLFSPNRAMMMDIEDFENIMRYIRDTMNPLKLSDAINHVKNQTALPNNTVVITFDDGYLDNYLNAYPLLRKYDIPATIFLSTSFISEPHQYFWWDEIEFYFKQYDFIYPENGIDHFKHIEAIINKINKNKYRSNADLIKKLINRLKSIGENNRNNLIKQISKNNQGLPKPRLMLNWQEVKEMSADGLIEFGSHSAGHSYMDELDPTEIESEIVDSKLIIEQQLEKPCLSFAYPNGNRTEAAERLLKKHGLEAAVTTEFGSNNGTSNLYNLRRKDSGLFLINSKIDKNHIRLMFDGFYDFYYK